MRQWETGTMVALAVRLMAKRAEKAIKNFFIVEVLAEFSKIRYDLMRGRRVEARK